ncbi:PD40 domain-containing protein [Thalassotalea sp. ND16A]|uniref:PD40 domain-containing protein n=1 Tax=Thalassotalea sp. ND16A TaxID=1535422 RepID=UPI00051A33B1|nr:PD40 domain-containing protein [Thalassotalea sp. ND16A]KGJ92300.1 hypothetical protein ND16A_1677 [Thalassotalea sp. ND16A]
MKKNFIFNTLLLFALMVSNTSQSQDKLPVLVGTYLGQKPPGLIPKAFAPGVISTEGYEYSGVFTPNMDEFYFIRGSEDNKKQEFVIYQKKDNRWYGEVMSSRLGQPAISPDGKTMHLGRRFLERTNNGWSERKNLDLPFTDILIMRLTSASNGTYYFDTWDESNEDFPIRYSRIVEGKYEVPKPLSKTINTGTQLNHPFIAPDESYLIWDAIRSEGHGDSDLYISYRQKDGSWGEAINLGDKINTGAWDAAGYVTPDGKYFFFNRTISPGVGDALPNVDIYWVDAQFIEALRPKI